MVFMRSCGEPEGSEENKNSVLPAEAFVTQRACQLLY